MGDDAMSQKKAKGPVMRCLHQNINTFGVMSHWGGVMGGFFPFLYFLKFLLQTDVAFMKRKTKSTFLNFKAFHQRAFVSLE